MKFIDFFAGIGGFRRGMELAGHECVGFCEFDKFAVASYTSMHLITDTQRETLAGMPIKQRQKEILKDEYRNGEWYANDIRNVDAGSLPEANCWIFGAPCQDFSIAGKRAGLDGDRSSLIREIFRLLAEQEEQDRPEWLIYENVKGMLSSNKGLDYLSILSEMDRLGYDIEWQNINSKWFVPQNRERIYTIGHLRRFGRRNVLPVTGTDGKSCIQQIGMKKSKRYNPNTYRVYAISGISPTIGTTQGGLRMPLWKTEKGVRKATPKEYFRLQGWTDDYFEKAAFVNSDSQLYKQAGNGVTVDVAEAIGDKINEYKKQRIPHHPRHDTAEQAGHRNKEQTRFRI